MHRAARAGSRRGARGAGCQSSLGQWWKFHTTTSRADASATAPPFCAGGPTRSPDRVLSFSSNRRRSCPARSGAVRDRRRTARAAPTCRAAGCVWPGGYRRLTRPRSLKKIFPIPLELFPVSTIFWSSQAKRPGCLSGPVTEAGAGRGVRCQLVPNLLFGGFGYEV